MAKQLPIARILRWSGWLAPDGQFYPCPWATHLIYAEILAEALQVKVTRSNSFNDHHAEYALELAGWFKVVASYAEVKIRRDPETWPRATAAQLTTLTKLLTARTIKRLPHAINVAFTQAGYRINGITCLDSAEWRAALQAILDHEAQHGNYA